MSDTAQLEARLAQLERELAALRAAPPEPAAVPGSYWLAQAATAPVTPPAPPPRKNIRISVLVGSNGLPRDPREIRRLVEAVALAHGSPSPAQEIPAGWEPEVRRLSAARDSGLGWREALAKAGLTPPPETSPALLEARGELRDVWGQLPPLLAWVEREAVSGHVYRDLTIFLGRLLA